MNYTRNSFVLLLALIGSSFHDGVAQLNFPTTTVATADGEAATNGAAVPMLISAIANETNRTDDDVEPIIGLVENVTEDLKEVVDNITGAVENITAEVVDMVDSNLTVDTTVTEPPVPPVEEEPEVPSVNVTVTETEPPIVYPKTECYDNLTEIFYVAMDDRLLFKEKKFILCPNKVYDMGIYHHEGNFSGIINGHHPIIPRMNSIYLCGEDGKTENNCILRGGYYGMISVPLLYELDYDTSNVLIKGMTFENNNLFSMFWGLPGTNVRVEDCIIRSNQNQGPLIFNNIGPWDFRRNLATRYEKYEHRWQKVNEYLKDLSSGVFDEEMEKHRELKEVAPLTITYKDVVYFNNTQIPDGENIEYGIITLRNKNHNVTFLNNLVYGNSYGNSTVSSIGYALLNSGSEVHIIDSCFIENDFYGPAPVIMNPDSTFGYSGNYGTEDDEVDCPFILSFPTEEAEENNEYECFNFTDDATCKVTIPSYIDWEQPEVSEDSESEDSAASITSQILSLALGVIAFFAL